MRINLWIIKYGDKVRVRSDLLINEYYGGIIWLASKEEFAGKMVTIKNVNGCDYYTLQEDPYNWYFTDEMLEPINNLNDYVTLGDPITIVKNDTKLIIHNDKIEIFKNDKLTHTIHN